MSIPSPRLLLVVLAFSLSTAPLSAQISAQTQSEMNADACGQYKKADQALNATYSKVLKDYATCAKPNGL
jgi:uncharacterized protein YecT (DUF1311 family)